MKLTFLPHEGFCAFVPWHSLSRGLEDHHAPCLLSKALSKDAVL
ncbi:rCG40638 [Rattus norvegicus]|uniref:RCG40638 n=1 Tax=Rattus norvegicus TaxID=10116 RepID=A6I605_RAT|nr:rCG40638 [Rattus norvegicus]